MNIKKEITEKITAMRDEYHRLKRILVDTNKDPLKLYKVD